MKDRCYYPRRKDRHIYIDRGIIVCDEWKNSYENFRDWALSSGFHPSLSLDRIDNYGNYEPKNCRWVDAKTQAQNQRPHKRKLYISETEYKMILCLVENKFEHKDISKTFKLKETDILYIQRLEREKNGKNTSMAT